MSKEKNLVKIKKSKNANTIFGYQLNLILMKIFGKKNVKQFYLMIGYL
jgi:hypothetical protein